MIVSFESSLSILVGFFFFFSPLDIGSECVIYFCRMYMTCRHSKKVQNHLVVHLLLGIL